ncbi:MAG: radical SAM protein, partial [Bacteroidales bacterium]
MPGIYIHIPYCRQACYYCNFHFSVSQKNKLAFLSALKQEIALSKNFFNKDKEPFEPVYLDTIYFGGGTPSLLSIEEIMDILNEISRYYIYDKNTEITLEANPDDLSQTKADALYNSPVNRLSIGIQSFHNDNLEYMNRSHNKYQAERSIVNSKNAGFNNIT